MPPSAQWSSGAPVTVNTRALIDKVLARYSGEYTFLRELCQNAADANAKNIVLRFESRNALAQREWGLEGGVLERGNAPAVDWKDCRGRLRDVLDDDRTGWGIRNLTYKLLFRGPVHHANDREHLAVGGGLSSTSSSQGGVGRATTGNSDFQRLIVMNDGDSFEEVDWDRLKKIAEGNPDETKMGAFGVGFYSVFSEFDEPAVYSGSKLLQFYWEGNQLCARERSEPVEPTSSQPFPWTIFHLPYRSPPLSLNMHSLITFLTRCVTFVPLESITLYVDDVRIFAINKTFGRARSVVVPQALNDSVARLEGSLDKTEGDNVQMTVSKVSRADVIVKARYLAKILGSTSQSQSSMSSALPRNREWSLLRSPASEIVNESCTLDLWQTTVDANICPESHEELKRATLKSPPQSTVISMVRAAQRDHTAADQSEPLVILRHLAPSHSSMDIPGRIFIGFETHQTSGLQYHLSSHSLIPTVERENIDLVARHVRSWNLEILRVAGIVSRIMYKEDILRLRVDMAEAQLFDMTQDLAQYTFTDTTPNPLIGKAIKQAFFKTRVDMLQILTLLGVRDLKDVRDTFPEDPPQHQGHPSRFLEKTAVVHKYMMQYGSGVLKPLRGQGSLRMMSVTDIVNDIKDRVLQPAQVQALIFWICDKCKRNQISSGDAKTITAVASVHRKEAQTVANKVDWVGGGYFSMPGGLECFEPPTTTRQESLLHIPEARPTLHLGSIRYCIDPEIFPGPTHMPLPANCVPQDLIHQSLSPGHLIHAFGWMPLTLENWVSELCKEKVFTERTQPSPNIGEYVKGILSLISQNWSSQTSVGRENIRRLLMDQPCIPTKFHGMQVPPAVHFPDTTMVGDLPLYDDDPATPISRECLRGLGVRETAELGNIVQYLMKKAHISLPNYPGLRSSTLQSELTQYILSSKTQIPTHEIHALRRIPFCSAENDATKLYLSSDLYEPQPWLRELGLPVLSWPVEWKDVTHSTKAILEELGVKSTLSLVELAVIAGDEKARSQEARDKALTYLFDQLATQEGANLDPCDVSDISFLPLEPTMCPGNYDSSSCLLPAEIFSSPKCAILGFPVLRQDLPQTLAKKLGVHPHPSGDDILTALLDNDPPPSFEAATAVFEYLEDIEASFTGSHLQKLGGANFVPILTQVSDPKESTTDNSTSERGDVSNNANSVEGVPSEIEAQFKYCSPSKIFTQPPEPICLAPLFDYGDFGRKANQFLARCGTQCRPSKRDVALHMVNDSRRILGLIGYVEYMNCLRSLAKDCEKFMGELVSTDVLYRKIYNSSWLLGMKMGPTKEESKNQVEDGEVEDGEVEKTDVGDTPVPMPDSAPKPKVFLLKPSQMFIQDDITSYTIFKSWIFIAPEEECLERFYALLGTPALSKGVNTTPRIIRYNKSESLDSSAKNMVLRKHIVERATLFVHDRPKEGWSCAPIEWLKVFEVEAAKHISVERVLSYTDISGTARTMKMWQPRTALVPHDEKKLYFLPGGDYLEIASALVVGWLGKPKPADGVLLHRLLTDDLTTLKKYGYDVDRILNTQAQFNQKEHPTSDIHELNDCEEIIGQQKPAKTSGALNWAHAGKIPNHSHNVEQEQLRQGGYKNISSGSDNPPLKRLGRGKYENIFNDPDDVKEQRLGPVEYTAIPRGRRSAHRGIPVLGVEPGYSDSNSIRTPSDLRKAINECKPHRWVDANITWKDVPFHQETCTTQVLNIEFQTTATNGISVFVEKKDDKMEMKSLLKANKTDFALFSNVLVDIATVMQLETAAIIMFVADEDSKMLGHKKPALNIRGSLFYNLRHFTELHSAGIDEDRSQALVYWFVVTCQMVAENVADGDIYSSALPRLISQFWEGIMESLGNRT